MTFVHIFTLKLCKQCDFGHLKLLQYFYSGYFLSYQLHNDQFFKNNSKPLLKVCYKKKISKYFCKNSQHRICIGHVSMSRTVCIHQFCSRFNPPHNNAIILFPSDSLPLNPIIASSTLEEERELLLEQITP